MTGQSAPASSKLGLVRELARKAASGATPFYLIGGVGGHVQAYSPICRAMRFERQSYGVMQPIAIGDAPLSCFNDFVLPMSDAIANHCRGEKLLLVGHSFGGLVAYDIACQLEITGYRAGVVMLDTMQPQGLRQDALRSYQWLRRATRFRAKDSDRRQQRTPRVEWIARQQRRLARRYNPPRSDLAISVLCASARGRMDDFLIGMDRQWSRRARVVFVREVPDTNHKSIVRPTSSETLRDALTAIEDAL